MRCSNCGSENPTGKKFCGDCGAQLEGTATSSRELRGALSGERRHLTVLFCDLVGSTEIATRLDPEEWRDVVASYHHATAEAITNFGGHVAHYFGDGVMAYFGWPEAYENNAERAVRAGLAILDAISKLNKNPARPKLSARIGIDSGGVVVGASAGKNAEIYGDAPNIASRVQAAALPDAILVTEETHRLVFGLFVVEACGTQTLKGLERPIQLYRVIQPSGVRGRLAALSAAHGLTPFVGRDDELRLLMTRWERTLEGEGQIVLISGEAGIGKSRLLQRFHEQIAGRRNNWVETAAGPFFQNTPFYPVAEILHQLPAHQGPSVTTVKGTNGHPANGASTRTAQQRGKLAPSRELDLEQQLEVTPQLAVALLNPYSAVAILDRLRPGEHPVSPHQRHLLLSTLVKWMVGSAHVVPLVIAIEDLHWADPSTLELIQLLVDQLARAPLLLLCTARPEFRAPWQRRTEITLGPLSAHHTRIMVEQLAGQKTLVEETFKTVVERTGGVPFFVEELTHSVLESGTANLTAREIPVTLHDSLMARLDRLGVAKEVLQSGAVIGTEFSYELLQAVHPIAEQDLQEALQRAADAELVYVHGIAPGATYQFKHALIRDAAYEALLKSRRRELHTQIVRTIETMFSEQRASSPEILAYHYTEAGLIAQAVRYWRKAGQKASERSANIEAISQLRKGLKLIKALPPTSERLMEEIKLQIALTAPLSATRGYLDPEVENACKRALELSRDVGETPQLFSVLGALTSIYFNRGELEVALELGRRMFRLADTQRDQALLLWAHYSLGFTFASQGVLKSARKHLERSIALYDPGKGGTYGYVQDPGPTAMVLLAHVIYKLGYPDQALERVDQALGLVRSLSHQFTVAWVLGFAGELYWRRGNKLAAQELWEEMAVLSNQQGFKLMIAKSSVFLGFVLVDQGRGDDGLKKMHEGLYSLGDALPMDEKVHGFGFFALALGKVGRVDEGLSKIDEALRLANREKTFKDLYLLQLIKGQLFLMKRAAGLRRAKQCFSAALELARKQKAKSDELRAAIPFAKLLVQQGRREQALLMLETIYNWFTEGFDTADLKEAKALLDQLG